MSALTIISSMATRLLLAELAGGYRREQGTEVAGTGGLTGQLALHRLCPGLDHAGITRILAVARQFAAKVFRTFAAAACGLEPVAQDHELRLAPDLVGLARGGAGAVRVLASPQQPVPGWSPRGDADGRHR